MQQLEKPYSKTHQIQLLNISQCSEFRLVTFANIYQKNALGNVRFYPVFYV